MSTHVPRFQSFFPCCLHHFVFANLATRSIRVNSSSSERAANPRSSGDYGIGGHPPRSLLHTDANFFQQDVEAVKVDHLYNV